MLTVRDTERVYSIRGRLTSEQIKRRTDAQNAARERKRRIESIGLADNRYTNSDQPELPIQIIIIDHRFNEVIEVDCFRSNRINSYNFFRGDSFLGKFGAARGLRELAKRLVPHLTNKE